MASRSGSRKKRPSARAGKKRALLGSVLRLLGVLSLVAVISGLIYLIGRYKTDLDRSIRKNIDIIFEEPCPPETIRVGKTDRPAPAHSLPRVAILIDDVGYNFNLDRSLIRLNAPFSFSLLPFAPHTKEMATIAHDHGKDVLLHLPMEPTSPLESKVGPGALFLNMDDGTIATQVQADIKAIPYIKGVNNHMGSRFTADAPKMAIVLREIREKNLFFIDSRTTPQTKGLKVAQSIGVKTARRDIFLDNLQEADAVRTQIAQLVSVAKTHGSAIGIGHPHPVTLEVLKQELPALKKQVKIVPISELVE